MTGPEWIAPASAILSSVALLGGGAIGYGALRQMVTTNQTAMTTLIDQNREDHALLFDQIRSESEKREEGDEQIRSDYLTIERCKDCPVRESVKHAMNRSDCRAYKDGRCSQ